MSKQFTLGKNERLKSRKSIEQLFNEGKKFTTTPFKIIYILNSSQKDAALLFGTGVSVKNFKKAVDRNRIKRLTREAYRLQKISLQEKIKANNIHLTIFFIYTGKELPGYDEIYKKTGVVLKKLEKIIEQ